MAARLEFRRREAGFYDVYRIGDNLPPVRLGVVTGSSGSWRAEGADGRTLTTFNTRKDAGKALLNYQRIRSI